MNRCYQLICEEDTAVSSFNRVNKFVWVVEQGVVASKRSCDVGVISREQLSVSYQAM